MVLRSPCLALFLAACIHKAPAQRLPQAAPLAAALVADRRDGAGVEELPAEVQDRVFQEVSAHNLEPRAVDGAATLGTARNTQQRLALLARGGDAPYLLLLEARVAYYDTLQGRFRWVVYARATVARRDDLLSAAASEFEVPVFLLYEHDREPEALKAAAAALAERTGALLDSFLAAAPPAGGALYFILIDRYANGDPSNDAGADRADPQAFHGGDLQGVLDHLDGLQALGVRSVWLSPVFRMRSEKFLGHGAFHGYWTEDLTQVEPRFGDEALLRKLSSALHRRGMRLLLDLVLNHVGPGARLAAEKPGWFHHRGSIADWNDPAQLETGDVSGLPDFAQENPEVYEYLLKASLQWAEIADGFRLDAVKHVPLAFWARFNAALHARKPGLELLGEALEGDPAKLAALQRDGGFDALFDFPLGFALTDVFCKAQPVGRLGAVLSLDRLYPDAAALATLLDDHDLPRLAGLCGGDLARVRQALLVQLALRGTPLITYGTESALAGLAEPDNRADMRFDAQPLHGWIATLLRLRRQHPALDHGAQQILAYDGDALWLSRTTPDEVVAIAIHGRALPAQLAGATLLLQAGDCALYALRGSFPTAAPALREVVLRAPGDLLAVGAGPELGSWDPAHGLPLRDGARLALPAHTIAEFKLVRRRADGSIEWERGANRYYFVPDGASLLDLTWRS